MRIPHPTRAIQQMLQQAANTNWPDVLKTVLAILTTIATIFGTLGISGSSDSKASKNSDTTNAAPAKPGKKPAPKPAPKPSPKPAPKPAVDGPYMFDSLQWKGGCQHEGSVTVNGEIYEHSLYKSDWYLCDSAYRDAVLSRKYKTFETDFGIRENVNNYNQKAVLRLFADDREIGSWEVTYPETTHVKVNVEGVNRLRVEMTAYDRSNKRRAWDGPALMRPVLYK